MDSVSYDIVLFMQTSWRIEEYDKLKRIPTKIGEREVVMFSISDRKYVVIRPFL